MRFLTNISNNNYSDMSFHADWRNALHKTQELYVTVDELQEKLRFVHMINQALFVEARRIFDEVINSSERMALLLDISVKLEPKHPSNRLIEELLFVIKQNAVKARKQLHRAVIKTAVNSGEASYLHASLQTTICALAISIRQLYDNLKKADFNAYAFLVS